MDSRLENCLIGELRQEMEGSISGLEIRDWLLRFRCNWFVELPKIK